jgi:hypothetical protein
MEISKIMLEKPPPLKDWRFWLRWTAIGIIFASVISLVRYYR